MSPVPSELGGNNSSRASVSRNFSSPARHFADDQDTDLDTSEYTDLSQVSWANEKPVRRQHRRHTAMALTTPVQNGERSCSSSRAREPPSARRSETSNRRATELSRHTESSRPKNTNSNEPPAEDLLSRVTELRRRNELQPFHMRTNYPIETQPAGTSPLHAVRGPSSSSASGRLPLVPEVESPCVAEDGRTASSSRHSAHLRPSSNHPSHEPLRTRSVSSSYDDAALSSTDDQSDIDYPPKQVNKKRAEVGKESTEKKFHLNRTTLGNHTPSAPVGRSSEKSVNERAGQPRSRPTSCLTTHSATPVWLACVDRIYSPKLSTFGSTIWSLPCPSTTAPRSRNPPARLTARTPATSQSSLAQTPSLVLTREKNSFRPASNSALRTSSTAEIASATTSGFKVPGPVKTKPLAVTSNGKWAPPSAVAASNSRRPLKETTSRTNRRT
nr:unnamed protein product [Spirometra erinaceieuropaei]